MLGVPVVGAVCEGFREQDDGSCRRFRVDHTGPRVDVLLDGLGQFVVALVTPRNTAEASVVGTRVEEVPGDDDETFDDFVQPRMMVDAGLGPGCLHGCAVVRVETPSFHSLILLHPVETIEAEGVTQSESQDGHDALVVEEVTVGFAIVEEPGSVRGASESRGLVRLRELLSIEELVEFRDFIQRQGVLDNEVALQVEEVFL